MMGKIQRGHEGTEERSHEGTTRRAGLRQKKRAFQEEIDASENDDDDDDFDDYQNDDDDDELNFPASHQDDDDDVEEENNDLSHPRKRLKSDDENLLKTKTKINPGTFRGLGLCEDVLVGIKRLEFRLPTPIQRKVIPVVLAGRDALAMSRTGSGKTASFLLPMMHLLKSSPSPLPGSIRAVILSPTRELTQQTFNVGKLLCSAGEVKLKMCCIQGGESLEDQFEMLTRRPDVVVATPGRLAHLALETGRDMSLSHVEMLVFDEADRLFEMGFVFDVKTTSFASQLQEIMNRTPESRQTLLFSATLPKRVAEFTRAGLKDPELIRLDTETRVSESLSLAFFRMRSEEKPAALVHLFSSVIDSTKETTIVFCGTKQETEFVCALLRKILGLAGKTKRTEPEVKKRTSKRGAETRGKHEKGRTDHEQEEAEEEEEEEEDTEEDRGVTMVHGSMDHFSRQRALSKFRSERVRVMVVTDVAARGLDIPHINNVVNYEFPDRPKLFVHRVGRAARQGRVGTAYSLATPEEMPSVIDVCAYLGRPVRTSDSNPSPNEEEEGKVEETVLGAFPRFLLDQEVERVASLLSSDVELENLFRSSTNSEKKRSKMREAPSKTAVNTYKQSLRGGDKIVIHPMFGGSELSGSAPLPESENTSNALSSEKVTLADLAKFRPSKTVFEVDVAKGGVKGKTGFSLISKGATSNVTLDSIFKTARRVEESKSKSLESLLVESENPKRRRGEEEEEEVDEEEDGENDATREESTPSFSKKRRLSKAERKRMKMGIPLPPSSSSSAIKEEKPTTDFYIPYEPRASVSKNGASSAQDRSYEGHLQITDGKQRLEDAIFDVGRGGGAEDGDDPTTRVRSVKWDKRKKQFIAGTMRDHILAGRMRNETGAFIAPKKGTHGEAYSKWQKKRGEVDEKGMRIRTLSSLDEEETAETAEGGARFSSNSNAESDFEVFNRSAKSKRWKKLNESNESVLKTSKRGGELRTGDEILKRRKRKAWEMERRNKNHNNKGQERDGGGGGAPFPKINKIRSKIKNAPRSFTSPYARSRILIKGGNPNGNKKNKRRRSGGPKFKFV